MVIRTISFVVVRYPYNLHLSQVPSLEKLHSNLVQDYAIACYSHTSPTVEILDSQVRARIDIHSTLCYRRDI
jgi:hypothetical protein